MADSSPASGSRTGSRGPPGGARLLGGLATRHPFLRLPQNEQLRVATGPLRRYGDLVSSVTYTITFESEVANMLNESMIYNVVGEARRVDREQPAAALERAVARAAVAADGRLANRWRVTCPPHAGCTLSRCTHDAQTEQHRYWSPWAYLGAWLEQAKDTTKDTASKD